MFQITFFFWGSLFDHYIIFLVINDSWYNVFSWNVLHNMIFFSVVPIDKTVIFTPNTKYDFKTIWTKLKWLKQIYSLTEPVSVSPGVAPPVLLHRAAPRPPLGAPHPPAHQQTVWSPAQAPSPRVQPGHAHRGLAHWPRPSRPLRKACQINIYLFT